MARLGRKRVGLGVGSGVSLVLHAAALALFGSAGPPARGGERLPHDMPSDEEMLERPRVGIESSKSASINWLGFRDPTPHEATPAETDQAQMTLDTPGRPAPAAQPAQRASAEPPNDPAPPPQPSAEPAARPTPEVAASPPVPTTEVGELAPSTPPSPAEADRPAEQTEQPPEEPAQETATAPDFSEGQRREAGDPQPAPPEEPAPPGVDDREGIPADRESSATSRPRELELNDLGRPIAGEGIEVKPYRPRWSATVKLTAAPRNPEVFIEFRGDGTVHNADFLTGPDGKPLSTGSTAVDGPLRDALFNWRASGPQIDALADRGPGSTLRLTFKIMLRR